jgi:hypothetical protein
MADMRVQPEPDVQSVPEGKQDVSPAAHGAIEDASSLQYPVLAAASSADVDIGADGKHIIISESPVSEDRLEADIGSTGPAVLAGRADITAAQ